MRHKSTVVSTRVHNQFSRSEKEIEMDKAKKTENWIKDNKEGQSEYRVEKKTGRNIVSR